MSEEGKAAFVRRTKRIVMVSESMSSSFAAKQQKIYI
jgi:hypothetical protein